VVIPYADYVASQSRDDSVPHEVAGYILLEGMSPAAAWRRHLRLTQAEVVVRIGINLIAARILWTVNAKGFDFMTTIKRMPRLALAALFGLSAPAFAGAPVTFDTKAFCVEGLQTPLKVEVAETQTQRNRGLMQREHLAEDAGMLFLFDGSMPKGVGFYMFRTLIPLDVAFADDEGRIVAIRTMTPCPHNDPRRCKVYRPGAAFVSALEVNAGFFERHGVKKGDRLFDAMDGHCDLLPDDAPISDSN